MSYDLRCHRCSYWIGESAEPMEFVGLFKDKRDRDQVQSPRATYQCKHCGWVNIFRRAVASFRRSIEIKAPTTARG